MNEPGSFRKRAVTAARERIADSVREAVRSVRAAIAWAWSRRPAPGRAAAMAFVVATAAASAWAVLAQARLPARLPSAIDWAAARALLERDARPGDAVVLAPPWAERAREVLPPSVAVLAQSRYAGEDLVGIRRVWLVSLPDAPRFSWDVEVDLLERAARSEPPARLGAIAVTRYELAFPTLPLAFLPDRLGRASVSLGPDPCVAEGDGRFRCRAGAARLERSVREVGGVPRPCLAAAAPAGMGAPLIVEFPATRIGRTLHGHAGPAGRGTGSALVRIAVQLDGEEVGAAEVSPAAWGAFRIDMTRVAGQTRPLALVLTSPGPLAMCFDAVVLP
jgi:hypothetical protein